jgi:hypothetical protein
MVFREFIKQSFQFFVEAVLHSISFIFCWSMNVQNNYMTPANATCEVRTCGDNTEMGLKVKC